MFIALLFRRSFGGNHLSDLILIPFYGNDRGYAMIPHSVSRLNLNAVVIYISNVAALIACVVESLVARTQTLGKVCGGFFRTSGDLPLSSCGEQKRHRRVAS